MVSTFHLGCASGFLSFCSPNAQNGQSQHKLHDGDTSNDPQIPALSAKLHCQPQILFYIFSLHFTWLGKRFVNSPLASFSTVSGISQGWSTSEAQHKAQKIFLYLNTFTPLSYAFKKEEVKTHTYYQGI
jgi:hypothetical protein